MSDIVERLREAAASLSEIYPDYAEAADEISRLRAENERLREALKPFARLSDRIASDYEDGRPDVTITLERVPVKCIRAAHHGMKA